MKMKKNSRRHTCHNNAGRPHCKKKWITLNWTPNSHRPNLSPNTSEPTLEHPIADREKPSLRRLKRQTKVVSLRQTKDKTTTGTNAQTNTNGEPGQDLGSNSDDSEDWYSFAQSVLENGTKSPCQESSVNADPGRLEEDSFHYCVIRDHVHNHAVLVIQPGQSLCFRGKCQLTCLYGRVEVLGFTVEEGQQSYPLFSPSSHCPLTITALSGDAGLSRPTKEGRLEAKAILRKYLSTEPRKRLLSEVTSDSCLVLLEPLDTPLTRFLTSLPEFNELFGLNSKDLQEQSAILDSPLSDIGMTPLRGSSGGLVMSQSYQDALTSLVNACAEELDGCPIILVCGARSAGKSTFSRHLINTLLNHTASVEYMECDLGQTEFTPPGCLSLSTVKEPLLGPPFTHQRTPEHMTFYGQTSCHTDLDRYLESLKSLWRSYTRETPIVINTMGWVKGFGFQLLVDIIRLFCVTHVVQLGFGNTTQCPPLSPDVLRSSHGWHTHPPAPPALGEEAENPCVLRTYVHHIVNSEFEGVGRPGELRYQRSNVLRDLTLLSYFSQLQSPEPGPIRPLHCFTPYQVPHSAVAVGVTHCNVAPTHMLYATNGSLVALCCLGEKVAGRGGPVLLSQTPVCSCLGFGVIRGVDMARSLYFLVTPVAPSVLWKVNCLLLGEVTLPHTLLIGQPGIVGEPPYVTTEYSFELTGAGKLTFYKGIIRPSFEKAKS